MAGGSGVVAVCGHESDGGSALRDLLAPGPGPTPGPTPGPVPGPGEFPLSLVTGGRELLQCIRDLLRRQGPDDRQEPLCVVPMTLGRDPELVADAARTLLALPVEERDRVVLAEPFGTAQHLVGWLRAAANQVPVEAGLLVTAPSGGPFEDAELFRIARLVRQYGRHRIVEVAFTDGDPDPAEGARRCRLLGAQRVALLPAAFVQPQPQPQRQPRPAQAEAILPVGPLLPAPALLRVVDARVTAARSRRRDRGESGIAAGLSAAHGHGLSHSHSHGDQGDHGHSHGDHGHGDHGHGDHGHSHHSHDHSDVPPGRDQSPQFPGDSGKPCAALAAHARRSTP